MSQKPPFYSPAILAMIEQGYLCDVKAIAIRTETSLDTFHTEGGDYGNRNWRQPSTRLSATSA